MSVADRTGLLWWKLGSESLTEGGESQLAASYSHNYTYCIETKVKATMPLLLTVGSKV